MPPLRPLVPVPTPAHRRTHPREVVFSAGGVLACRGEETIYALQSPESGDRGP